MDRWLNKIINGDCLEVMKTMPDGLVNCIVTSPPYWGLRDYGVEGQLGLESTPEEYTSKMVAIFREARRVLRDDGTLWLNLGDTYAGNRSYQVPDNKHCTVGNTIGMTVSRRRDNALIPRSDLCVSGLKNKDMVGIPWRVAFALQADGWYLRSEIIWHKPNPMPESVTDRPTKAHEYIFLLSKSAQYFYDAEAIKEESVYQGDDRKGRASKDHKCMPDAMKNGIRPPKSFKGSQFNTGKTAIHQLGRSSGRPRVTGNLPGLDDQGRACNGPGQEMRNKRSVWTVTTHPYNEAHFATFPPELIKPCILAGCPENGIVLDPFFGAGTTGVVCADLGRNYIGIELNPEYVAMAEQRIARATAQTRMFV